MSHDVGVENLSLRELYPEQYGAEDIEDGVRKLLRDKSIWTALDNDLKGPQMRPGRVAIVLKVLLEELVPVYGSVREAADCLVLSAVRAGGTAIDQQLRDIAKKRNR